MANQSNFVEISHSVTNGTIFSLSKMAAAAILNCIVIFVSMSKLCLIANFHAFPSSSVTIGHMVETWRQISKSKTAATTVFVADMCFPILWLCSSVLKPCTGTMVIPRIPVVIFGMEMTSTALGYTDEGSG